MLQLLEVLRNGHLHRREEGQALVEYALILSLVSIAAHVVLVVLLGMVDFGRGFDYWIDGTHLSATDARWAAVNINPGDGATLQEWIRDQADTAELRNGGTGAVADAVTVCIAFRDGPSSGG